MTGQTADNLIAFGSTGIWVVVALLVPQAMRSGSLHPTPKGFAFHRPPAQCAVMGLLGLNCLLIPFIEASYDLRLYGAVRPDHWPYLWAFAAFGLAGAAFLFWLGGPKELAVDEEQGTYRRSEGWPPFRLVRIGPLSDLEGVRTEYNVSSGYGIYLYWQSRGGRMIVARFKSLGGAEHYADELAAVLGVPRLAPPRPARFLPGAAPTQPSLHPTPPYWGSAE